MIKTKCDTLPLPMGVCIADSARCYFTQMPPSELLRAGISTRGPWWSTCYGLACHVLIITMMMIKLGLAGDYQDDNDDADDDDRWHVEPGWKGGRRLKWGDGHPIQSCPVASPLPSMTFSTFSHLFNPLDSLTKSNSKWIIQVASSQDAKPW